MTPTEFTAAILVHLDTLHNLAAWLSHDSAATNALVRATCQQALRGIPQPLSGTNLRVGLLSIMWGLYRQDHPPTADELDPKTVKRVSFDKRMLFHTLAKTDLDASLRQLPEAPRAALILTDIEGYPLEDVAAIFGWSKSRTQEVLSNARQLLDCFLQGRLSVATTSPAPDTEDAP